MWNSELVLVDADVVRFVDLAMGEVRSADLSEEIRPPVAFFEDSIAFSNGRDLIRLTPGFANPRVVRAGARDVSPLPGLPVAFHDLDPTGPVEIIVVGDEMGSITWLATGYRPWAMWNGRILASVDERIELISLDGSDSELLAEGTVLAASGGAVLYRACPDRAGSSAGPGGVEAAGDDDGETGADPPGKPPEVVPGSSWVGGL